MLRLRLLLTVTCLTGWLTSAGASAAESWPAGCTLDEENRSPDGRYGLLLPEAGNPVHDGEEVVDYLVELPAHRLVGKLTGCAHWAEARHSSLRVQWSPDSTCGAADFAYRTGTGTYLWFEIADGQLHLNQLMPHLEQLARGAISAKRRPAGTALSVEPYGRVAANRKLTIRALVAVNPQHDEVNPTCYGLLQAVYDGAAHRWSQADARMISEATYEAVATQYDNADLDTPPGFATEAANLEWLDTKLNEAYAAVEAMLPSGPFARVKKEQLAWLKTYEATAAEGKLALLEARVRQLRDLLW